MVSLRTLWYRLCQPAGTLPEGICGRDEASEALFGKIDRYHGPNYDWKARRTMRGHEAEIGWTDEGNRGRPWSSHVYIVVDLMLNFMTPGVLGGSQIDWLILYFFCLESLVSFLLHVFTLSVSQHIYIHPCYSF
ncbi:hypothetical protein BJX66DRAFT_288908 [Aspergillus keveii]|uniref:Uncharacterized protein n=1 Tax=Aspergillus keveii TaxID=714993 RepID=A0ABR4GPN2_9EURO